MRLYVMVLAICHDPNFREWQSRWRLYETSITTTKTTEAMTQQRIQRRSWEDACAGASSATNIVWIFVTVEQAYEYLQTMTGEGI